MSKTIDERVVEMRFDNKRFEENVKTSLLTLDKLKEALKLDKAAEGFADIGKAVKDVSFASIESGIQTLQDRFSTLGIISTRILENITDSVMKLASKALGFLTNGVIQGGINRAMNLENANFQLLGLLKNEEAVAAVMEDVDYAVSGTAYSLDAAAKVASQLAASEMRAGQDMKTALRGVAGVAAMTNSSYEDMGKIFTTVAGNGRLMGDQLLQLSSRGLNAAATLGEYLHKSEAEIRDMVSKGQIDFNTFAKAMDSTFGEHAKDANKTFTGAMSNIRSALGRIGAAFVSPIIKSESEVVKLFNTIREKINQVKKALVFDSENLFGIKNFEDRALDQVFTKSVLGAAEKIRNALESLDLTPYVKIFYQVFGVFKIVFHNISTIIKSVSDGFNNLSDKIKSLFPDTSAKAILEIVNKIKEFANGLKITKKDAEALTKVFTTMFAAIRPVVGMFRLTFRTITRLITSIGQAIERSFSGPSLKQIDEFLHAFRRGAIEVKKFFKEFKIGEKDIKPLTNAFALLFTSLKTVGSSLSVIFEQVFKLLTGSFESIFGKTDKAEKELNGLSRTASAIIGVVHKLTDSINNVAMSFILFERSLLSGDDEAKDISNTFKGLFAIIDIGIQLVKSIVSAIFSLDVSFDGLGSKILGITGKIGEWLVELDKSIKENDTFTKIINKLRDGISSFIAIVTSGITMVLDFAGSIFEMGKAFIMGLPLKEIGSKIVEIVTNIKNLITSFRTSEGDAENLKNIFRGFFAVLDIGVQAIKALVGGIASLTDSESPLYNIGNVLSVIGSKLLEVAGKIGLFLVKLDEYIKENDIFGKAVEKVVEFIKNFRDEIIALGERVSPVLGKIKEELSGVVTAIKAFAEEHFVPPDMTDFYTFAEEVSKRFEPMRKIFGFIGSVLETVFGIVSYFVPKIVDLIKTLWSGILKLGKVISETFTGGGVSGFLDLLSTGLLGGIALEISTFVRTLQGTVAKANGILVGIKTILNEARISLEVWQNTLKANVILKIASAIAILAVSLTVLSMIDPAKLAAASAVVTAMFGELVASMKIMNPTEFGVGMKFAGTAMLKMAEAVLILAAAMKVISKIDPERLAASMVSVTVLIGDMTAAMVTLSKYGKSVETSSTSILAFAVAIGILSGAVKKLASIEPKALIAGMTAITVLMAEMMGVMIGLSKLGGKVETSAATIVVFALSIKILASAVKKLAELDKESLTKGMTAVTALMLEMTASLTIVGKLGGKVQVGALAIIALAASMLILASAVKTLGELDREALTKGMTAITGLMIEMTAALVVLSKHATKVGTAAAGMVLVANAMKIMAGVMADFAKMQMDEIGRSLLALAGTLGILVAAMKLMSGGLKGAAATLVIAGALDLLYPALKGFSKMDLAEIGKSLLMLAGVFTVLGAAGAILGPLVPAILGVSGAVALLGVGVLACGVGLMALVTALGIFAAEWVTLEAIMPKIAEIIVFSLLNALSRLLGGIVKAIPIIVDTLLQAASQILDSIAETLVKLAEIVVKSIDKLLVILAEHAPSIAESVKTIAKEIIDTIFTLGEDIILHVIELLDNVLKAISEHAPSIGESLKIIGTVIIDILFTLGEHIIKNVIELIDNVLAAIADHAESISDSVSRIIEIVVNSIVQNTATIASAVMVMIETLLDVAYEHSKPIAQRLIDILQLVLETLRDNVGPMTVTIAAIVVKIVDVVLEKLIGLASKIVDAAKTIAKLAIEGVLELVKEISPEIVDTLSYLADIVMDAIKKMEPKFLDTLNSIMETMKKLVSILIKGIIEIIKGSATDISNTIIYLANIALKTVLTLRDRIIAIVYTIVETVKSTVYYIIESILQTLIDNTNAVCDTINYLASEVLRTILELQPKIMTAIYTIVETIKSTVYYIIESILQTIIDNTNAVCDTLNYLASEVLRTILELQPKIMTAIYTIVESIEIVINYLIKTALELVKTSSDAVVETILYLADKVVETVQGLSDRMIEISEIISTTLIKLLKTVRDNVGEIVGIVLDAVINLIKAISDRIPEFIQLGFDIILNLINGLSEALDKNAEPLRKAFEKLLKSILNFVLTFFGIHSPSTVFAEIGKNLIQGMINGIGDMLSKILKKMKELMSEIIKVIKDKFNDFKLKGRELMTNLKTGIADKINEIRDKATEVVSSAINGIRNKYNEFKEAGNFIIEGLKNGINNAKDKVIDTVKGIASSAIDVVKEFLGIHSPSTVFEDIGKNVDKGLIVGIETYSQKVSRSALDLGKKTVSGIEKSLDSFSKVVDAGIETNPVIRPVLDLTDIVNGVNNMNRMFSTKRSVVIASSASVGVDTAISRLQNQNEGGIELDDSNILDALGALRGDVSSLADAISKMQVVMDSGALVGALADPLDSALGMKAAYQRRGN